MGLVFCGFYLKPFLPVSWCCIRHREALVGRAEDGRVFCWSHQYFFSMQKRVHGAFLKSQVYDTQRGSGQVSAATWIICSNPPHFQLSLMMLMMRCFSPCLRSPFPLCKNGAQELCPGWTLGPRTFAKSSLSPTYSESWVSKEMPLIALLPHSLQNDRV